MNLAKATNIYFICVSKGQMWKKLGYMAKPQP